MEDARNIYVTCSDCASKPQQKFTLWDINTFVNKWVKKSFPEVNSERKEHLWIKINQVNDDKTLTGTVDNDTVLNLSVKSGDIVQVKVEEIEACFDGKDLI